MTTKTCNQCNETKLDMLFSKDKNRSDGLNPRCKICVSKADKERRENKKDKPADAKEHFKSGDNLIDQTAYLLDGTMVHAHYKIDNQYVVENLLEINPFDGDEDEFELSGRKFFVDNIYHEEPTNALGKGIAKARETLSEINKNINDARNEFKTKEREHKETLDKFAKIPALKHVLDFINGDFEYFAYPEAYGNEASIGTKNKDLECDDNYDRDTKLLTLFGRTKGDLEWQLNRYSDGSGSSSIVQPCKTIEDAQEYLDNWHTNKISKEMKTEKPYMPRLYKSIEWLKSRDKTIQEGVEDKIKAYRDNESDRSIKSYEKTIANAQASIDKLKESM